MFLTSHNTADCNARIPKPISRSFTLQILSLNAALLAASCSRSSSPDHSSTGDVRKAETVLPFSGEMWLKWDKSSRLAFVMGNLRGYWDGQGAGCGEAKIVAQSLPAVTGLTEDVAEQMRFRCANKFKLSKRDFESYEEVVTEFYSRYPEARTIEIQDVLQLLAWDSDGKLTAKDIRKRITISQ